MKEIKPMLQLETLILALREGMCVEDQRCGIRDAASGCNCAVIADHIERLAIKIKTTRKALLEICDGSNWPEYAQTGDGYRAYGEITEQLHDIASTLTER